MVTCLLSGPAHGLTSPPSAQLAFVTGTGMAPDQVSVVLSPGGETRVVAAGEEPLLSPDGSHVAYSLFSAGSETGPALAVYDVATAAASSYLSLAKFTVQPLAWSPDSRYLAFYARSTALRGIPARSALDVLDTTTGAIVTLAHGQISGASFSPEGRDLLAFSKSPAEQDFPVDLYSVPAAGGPLRRLTFDRHSLNPVWGAKGIAFDRERLRRDDAPVFQIWLDPAHPRQITRVKVPVLLSGLVPIAFSADGTRLIAEYGGEDTSEAWTVEIADRRARRLTVGGRQVIGDGISADGSTVLVSEGSFEEPPSSARIVTLPFAGGAPSVLVAHGSAASWNR